MTRRYRHAVQLADMCLDISGAHPAAVKGDDFIVEAAKWALILGNQCRVESAVTVSRGRQHEFAVVA